MAATLVDRLRPFPGGMARAAGAGAALHKHRGKALGLWIAFLAGMVGASIWHDRSEPFRSPVASVSVSPAALPFVAGRDPSDLPLPQSPLRAIEEVTDLGPLPIRGGHNGLTAYSVYGYPFDRADQRNKVAFILTGTSQLQQLRQQALQKLPGAVALSLSPLAPDFATQVTTAREAGHEVLLEVMAENREMTPSSTANIVDPGPGALRVSLPPEENLQRLHLMMTKASGYVGLTFARDVGVLKQNSFMRDLLADVQSRGILMVSPDLTEEQIGNGQSVFLKPAERVDLQLSPEAIDLSLADLEQRARERGQVLVVAEATPLLIDRLINWLPGLAERGMVLAPPSALAPAPMVAGTQQQINATDSSHDDGAAPADNHADDHGAAHH
jgi:polysaccharide deacetylase 2 family uncharacterized protein YibQ